jgi:hypothetical protein
MWKLINKRSTFFRPGIASVACALAAFERFPHLRGRDTRSVLPAPEISENSEQSVRR